ncbi:hypothetical protein [Hoyosella altamirensis]|uniref:Uncharacterized protein n=1 Tax=Hoyosella altamirensis TaxID=616997 RepID=A0A839RVQ8_9ACTN|nr:hypothetical protein [Hoyosella altamirensis]MBB3040104.1 hypothetical protein [Hoyosella altamirensis]
MHATVYRITEKPHIGRQRFSTADGTLYGWWIVSAIAQIEGTDHITMLGDEHDTWHAAMQEAHALITAYGTDRAGT